MSEFRQQTDPIVGAVVALADKVLEQFESAPVVGGIYPWRREDEHNFRMVLDQTDDSLAVVVAAHNLEDSGEHATATEAIEADEGLRPFLGKLIGDPFTRTGLYADRLLQGMVVHAFSRTTDRAGAVETSLEAIRDLLGRATRVKRLLTPLPDGFRPEVSSPVALDDRTSLRALDDGDIATVLNIGLSFTELPEPFGIAYVGTPWGIEVTFELPAVALGEGEEVPDAIRDAAFESEADASAQLVRVVQALRITKSGRISPIGRLTISDDVILGGLGVRFTTPRFPRPLFDLYELQEMDLERLRSVLGLLAHASVRSSPALQTAVRRFSSSIERHDPEDRLVDLIVSAEALFGTDSDQPGDLSLRVAQRFARFVHAPDGMPLMELFQHMKRQYGGRSTIVHALARTPGVQRKIARALEGVDVTEDLMRKAIYRALTETVGRGKFEIDWNRLVLEGS